MTNEPSVESRLRSRIAELEAEVRIMRFQRDAVRAQRDGLRQQIAAALTQMTDTPPSFMTAIEILKAIPAEQT